ncbi:MAG: hypothetical protein SA378_00495 [Sedimentibacter sp.]|uniref:anti-sigma-I factor RsgI family protein n=1 Tax=Sedimentibacter sp. TaxID=1960295 RepID=UPI0029814F40|nr:hypothetical protein [Sedimentibacter sp.]MDW5298608.1 hypothetical protein [Sedimentibacter sp.]
MKATVLEINDGFAALIQEDGTIVKIKSKSLKIGDVVKMKETKIRKKGRFSAMVAAAMFVMMLVGGVYTYATPSYYVSLDVNPGILMEVNMFERVIGMEAANEDAKEVLAGLNLKNKDIEDAVSLAVERVKELGYFDGEGGNILIATTAKNEDKAERLAGKLQNAVEEEIEENGVKAEVTAGAIGYEMVQSAKAIEGMTPGKYNVIVNLLGIDPEKADDYAGTSIKDIMKEYTASKGEEGKARAEEAAVNSQTEEENGEPAENEGLKEQNAQGKAEQAGSQEGNSPVDTPASDKKAPSANAMQNNVAE